MSLTKGLLMWGFGIPDSFIHNVCIAALVELVRRRSLERPSNLILGHVWPGDAIRSPH